MPRAVERGPAAQAVISRVGEIDFARAAYKELPSEVHLQMIQAKARAADAAWLEVFWAHRAFGLPPRDPPGADHAWRLHPQADPAIEALALLLHPARYQRVIESRLDGNNFGVVVDHRELVLSSQAHLVLASIVCDFAAAIPAEMPDPVYRARVLANAAVMLCVAIAAGDETAVQALCEKAPQALAVPLREDIISPQPEKANNWVTPAFVAMQYGQAQALRVLAAHGWSVTDPVRFRRTERRNQAENPARILEEANQPSGRAHALAPLDLVVQAATGLEHFANMRTETLDVVLELLRRQDDSWPNKSRLQWLARALEGCVSRNSCTGRLAVVETCEEHGMFASPEATRALVRAAAQGFNGGLMARLRHRLDWAAFDNDDFPPYVALARQPGTLVEPDKKRFVTELCRWCVESGHGHRLADHRYRSDYGHGTLLHLLVANGVDDAVALALEHGADLSVTNSAGLTPLQCALDHGRESTATLLRSFAARRAAAAALADLGGPIP